MQNPLYGGTQFASKVIKIRTALEDDPFIENDDRLARVIESFFSHPKELLDALKGNAKTWNAYVTKVSLRQRAADGRKRA